MSFRDGLMRRRGPGLWEAVGSVRCLLAEYVPDSGQEHTADGDNGFFVPPPCFDAKVAYPKFRVLLGFDERVSDLHKEWFKICTGVRDSSGLDFSSALVISWAAARPGAEVLCGGEDGHIDANFRDNGNHGHYVPIQTGDGLKQLQCLWKRFDELKNFFFHTVFVAFQFVNMVETFPELNGLFRGDCTVYSGLNFPDRCFATTIHKRSNIKFLSGMGKNILRNRPGRFTENVGKDVIKFQIGDSKTVLSAIFLPCRHTDEFTSISNQITEMTDWSRRNKAGLDHVAHEQVAYPGRVLAVCLISLLRFGVFGMGKDNTASLFKDVENRYPVFACGFHTNLGATVLGKPVRQFSQSVGKGRKPGFMVLSTGVVVRDPNTSVDPSFVDIKSGTVVTNNFEQGIPPVESFAGSAGTGRQAKSRRLQRDKFPGYFFTPFVDALTDDRHHI